MTNLFRASNWVSSSNDSIVSRGVTTCAGMTAHTVLLAQTKVGFLTGGRKKSFRLLSEDEQMVQLEEAYARATVAITRARSLCLIMGPLDMKGLLGAATVMGTLMYGAGHVWEGQAHFYLHDGELSSALARCNFHPHAPAELQSDWPAFPSPGDCGGTARLCHALPPGSAVAPHCCGLVAALEVQHCPSQGNHWSIVVYFSLWCHAPREPIQAWWPRAATSVPPICIWICPGWFWMSELLCLASKGWTFICSIGHLHKRHASSESRFFSPFGYGTFLWFICTGVSDQCPSRSYALVWLARRWTDAWPAYYQRWSVAY